MVCKDCLSKYSYWNCFQEGDDDYEAEEGGEEEEEEDDAVDEEDGKCFWNGGNLNYGES